MNRLLTNKSISDLYKKNKNNKSLKWKKKLFKDLYFLINKKKYLSDKDLFQEVSIGLWSAIITFDFNKNFDFFRWSKWHISSRVKSYKLKKSKLRIFENSIKLDGLNIGDRLDVRSNRSMLEFDIDFKKWLDRDGSDLEKRNAKIIADWLFAGNSLTQVAKENGLSIERIRQIKDSELKKLSIFLNS